MWEESEGGRGREGTAETKRLFGFSRILRLFLSSSVWQLLHNGEPASESSRPSYWLPRLSVTPPFHRRGPPEQKWPVPPL